MGKDESNTLANLISTLGLFENDVSLLYRDIAAKVWLPLIESMLLEISLDSQKHSIILKGIEDSLPRIDCASKDCDKTFVETRRTIEKFRDEVRSAPSLDEEEIMELSVQLLAIENIMIDEYKFFVEFATQQLMTNALQRIYNVNENIVRTLFADMISDENRHKEKLTTIKDLLDWRELRRVDNTPKVLYRNPDAWSRPP